MLTEAQLKLWEAYQHAEGRDPRAKKLLALESFLVSLSASTQSEWFPWARSLAERVVDGGEKLILRRPLFERAVFPALLTGFRAGLPGCARWLAGLSQHLLNDRGECSEQLPLEARTEWELLREALRRDPADRLSRRRLIDKMAGRLRFSLHEIPAGVLYGMDGASPEQCVELEQELEIFSRLAEEENLEQDYRELIQSCRLHFSAYRDYLLHRVRDCSYEQYLAQKQAQGRK